MRTGFLVLLFVFPVFGDAGEEKSVKEGENVTLPTDVKQPNETIRWYFNGTLIALINGGPSNSCLYDGEGGIFRDRLKVVYKTGSLTVTNISPEHAGRYEANIIRGNSAGTSKHLNRNSKCNRTKIINKSSNSGDTIKTFNVRVVSGETLKDSGLSSTVIAGTCGVLLVVIAAGGVIYSCRRSSRNDVEKNKQEVLLKK